MGVIRPRKADRVKMVRTLLEQRAGMERCALSELEWVRFRLGCHISEARKLIALAKQPEEAKAKA
jgi:hypothetical protein